MEETILTCVVCKKPLNKTALFFCSINCKDKYYNHKRLNKENNLICLVCGKQLKGNQRMYCSNDCRWKKHSQIKRKKDYYKEWFKEYRKREKWKEYYKDYLKKYNPRRRDYIRRCLGNKCMLCDFTEVLEFHHINERNGRIDNIFSVKAIESGNLILLCPNHHALLHKKKLSLTKEEMFKMAKELLVKNKESIILGKVKV